MRARGFTLIELLIVVAIIAILAAIAVPNFLEAQTRSKVSRTYADMRTVVGAIRAYEVDNNGKGMPCPGYVPGLTADYVWIWLVELNGRKAGAGRYLTSPVPYMTTIPMDVFTNKVSTSHGPVKDLSYNWWCGGATEYKLETMNCFAEGGPISPRYDKYPATYAKRAYRWSMISPGPDRVWWPINRGVIYDPTNGTTSGGDIWYVDSIGFLGGKR
jgi:prepilin-type N-terminal cleavage/methylation domain-containing protein